MSKILIVEDEINISKLILSHLNKIDQIQQITYNYWYYRLFYIFIT